MLVQPLQTALSLLVPSLAQDALLSDLQSRATALALLHLLLQSSLGEEMMRLLLREKETIQVRFATSVSFQALLQLFAYVDTSLLEDTSLASHEGELRESGVVDRPGGVGWLHLEH